MHAQSLQDVTNISSYSTWITELFGIIPEWSANSRIHIYCCILDFHIQWRSKLKSKFSAHVQSIFTDQDTGSASRSLLNDGCKRHLMEHTLFASFQPGNVYLSPVLREEATKLHANQM